MARVFSTHFPLDSSATIDDFLDIGKEWVYNSPHTRLSKGHLVPLKSHGEKAEREGYYFEIGRVKADDNEILGINYANPDKGGSIWNTKVIGLKQKNSFSASISVDFESPGVRQRLPQCSRPYLIKLLLQRIGGGMDGDLMVKEKPHYIADGRGDEDFIAGILNGSAKSIMPVVYVSRNNNELCIVNTDLLAYRLSGVAHVLIEPSRDFSFKLKSQTNSQNVFGGAVGVYWAEGYDKYFWLPDTLQAQTDPIEVIFCKVVELLNSRKIPKELTWDNLQSLHNRHIIETMKLDHEGNLDSLLETYSNQLNLTAHQLKEAEERNSKLERELRTALFSRQGSGKGIVPDPQIQQIYKGELITIISDALSIASQNAYKNSRRAKILEGLAGSMHASPESREEMTEKIKQMFKDYRRMSGPMRNELEGMGFLLLEDGPHYKLVLANDPNGLSVTIAKTPSDFRAGKNTASDIIKMFF